MLNKDFLQSVPGFLSFHSYIINDWFVVGKKHLDKSSFPVDLF